MRKTSLSARLLLVTALAGAFAPIPPAHGDGPPAVSQARVDFLRALNLAAEGSKPEALALLAASLRQQLADNPAAGLAFQLLTEERADSSLRLRGHRGAINSVAYNADGSKIVTASDDGTARIWDARTGRQLGPALKHEEEVKMAIFSPDGTRVATASDDRTARVWDTATGEPVTPPLPAAHAHEMQCVRFSPDGTILATGADEGVAQLWDARTGEPKSPLPRYHGDIFSINFSPDGTRLVTANGDGRADLFSTETGKPVVRGIGQPNSIYTAAFSPDGARVLTASAGHSAQIWDATTGKPIGPAMTHGFWVWSAAFDADAARVVTASGDHTARVWDARSGEPLTPPLQHGDAVYSALFSPDGRCVATASRDRTARLWDAATGMPLSLPLRAGDEIKAIAFQPGGSSLLVGSKDGTVRAWDVPPHDSAPAWLADLADFAAARVRYDVRRSPRMDLIAPLRERLLASTADDPWAKFGRWYFQEVDARPISPWSTVSLKEYVDGLVALGDKDSLDYAVELSRPIPSWMVAILTQRSKMEAQIPASTPKPAADKDDD